MIHLHLTFNCYLMIIWWFIASFKEAQFFFRSLHILHLPHLFVEKKKATSRQGQTCSLFDLSNQLLTFKRRNIIPSNSLSFYHFYFHFSFCGEAIVRRLLKGNVEWRNYFSFPRNPFLFRLKMGRWQGCTSQICTRELPQ